MRYDVRSMHEDGNGAVMIIGLLLLSLVVAGLAIDTTRLIIVRRELQNACDAGVLAGASQIDEVRLRETGGGLIVLDIPAARARAASTIAIQAPRGHEFRVVATESDVAATVTVRVQLLFLQLLGTLETDLDASCRAAPWIPRTPE